MVQRVKKRSKRFFMGAWGSISVFFSFIGLAMMLLLSLAAEALRPKIGFKGTKKKCVCKHYPKEENEKTQDKKYEYWRRHGRIYFSPVGDKVRYPHLKKCKRCGGAL